MLYINPIMMKIDEAQRLYNDLGYTEYRDPINWLLHQKEERTEWEEYNKLLEQSSHPLRKEILQEDYNKYREFMYENYPSNFHNRLIFHWLDNAFGLKCNCKCDEKKYATKYFISKRPQNIEINIGYILKYFK